MQKNTENTIMLSNLGGLEENDLRVIEAQLSILDIDLKVITPDHRNINYFEDFSLQTFYAFSPSFLMGMINHERGKEVWSSVKAIIAYSKTILSGKEYIKEIEGALTHKPIKFGIHIILDTNTSYNFDLSEIPDGKLFEESLDKILSFLVRQFPNEKYELPCYVRFSLDTKEWSGESFEEYLLKKSMSN